jgi:hypothetical protein
MPSPADDRDPATEAVRAALFKVVSTADLTDPDQAVGWARAALDNETLLESMGAGAHRAATGKTQGRGPQGG